jgi:hypothetical protein
MTLWAIDASATLTLPSCYKQVTRPALCLMRIEF